MSKTFQGRTFLDPAKFLQQNRLHMLALLLRDADMWQSVATLVSPFDTSAEEGPLSAVATVDTALPPHAEASLSTLLSDSRVGSTLDEMGQARSNAPAVTDVHFEGTLLPVEQLRRLAELLEEQDCFGASPAQRAFGSLQFLANQLGGQTHCLRCVAILRFLCISRLLLTACGYCVTLQHPHERGPQGAPRNSPSLPNEASFDCLQQPEAILTPPLSELSILSAEQACHSESYSGRHRQAGVALWLHAKSSVHGSETYLS